MSLKWQDIAKVAGGGSVGLVTVLVLILNLSGMTYSHTGDIYCETNCTSQIQVNSTYWEVCAEHAGTGKDVVFKKQATSRRLWVNLDKIDSFIETNPSVEVKLLVPTTKAYSEINDPNYGYLREIKDGDCFIKRQTKSNPSGSRFVIMGNKGEFQNVKWSFSLDSILMEDINIDPWWNASYAYAKGFNVTETSGTKIGDYPISFWFGHGGHANSICSDVVFINATTGTKVNFALSECNTTHVLVGMRVNSSASEVVDDYYAYYGNNTPVAFNNVSLKYVQWSFYDDFDTGETAGGHPSKWFVGMETTTDDTVNISTTRYNTTPNSMKYRDMQNDANSPVVFRNFTYQIPWGKVEIDINIDNHPSGTGLIWKIRNATGAAMIQCESDSGNNWKCYNGGSETDTMYNNVLDRWSNYTYEWQLSNKWNFSADGGKKTGGGYGFLNNVGEPYQIYFSGGTSGEWDGYIDNVKVLQYLSSPPTVTFGEEVMELDIIYPPNTTEFRLNASSCSGPGCYQNGTFEPENQTDLTPYFTLVNNGAGTKPLFNASINVTFGYMDTNNTGPAGGRQDFYNATTFKGLAQGFTLAEYTNIDYITVGLLRNTTEYTGTLNVGLYSGSTKPETLITSTNISGALLQNTTTHTNNMTTVQLSATNLSPGTTYYIGVIDYNGTKTKNPAWARAGIGDYTGGTSYYWSGSAWSAIADLDFRFAVYTYDYPPCIELWLSPNNTLEESVDYNLSYVAWHKNMNRTVATNIASGANQTLWGFIKLMSCQAGTYFDFDWIFES